MRTDSICLLRVSRAFRKMWKMCINSFNVLKEDDLKIYKLVVSDDSSDESLDMSPRKQSAEPL
jgi:hypothetical protein